MADSLKQHGIRLRTKLASGDTLLLRPMTEADWSLLYAWNNAPEVLFYAEGDDVGRRSLEETQAIYRHVSQSAFCFIMEVDGTPVGECWLQRMNLDRVLMAYPGRDVRRIDLMIGEKGHWNHGIGTVVVQLLTEFAFNHVQCDVIYIPDVADYNYRSGRVFEKNGYREVARRKAKPGGKAAYTVDFVLDAESFAVNLPEQLRSLLGEDGYNQLTVKLRTRSSATILTPKYVVKVRTCRSPYFLQLLHNERDFLVAHPSLPFPLPVVVYHDLDRRRGILVTSRVDGSPMAETRESHAIPSRLHDYVLDTIRELQQVPLPAGWNLDRDRNERLGHYVKLISTVKSPSWTDVLTDLQELVGHLREPTHGVLSHGDLNPTNILVDGHSLSFVDWEHVGCRPASFDPVCFVLFTSWKDAGLSRLNELSVTWSARDVWEDAIVVAARQLKNWLLEGPGGEPASAKCKHWAQVLEALLAYPLGHGWTHTR